MPNIYGTILHSYHALLVFLNSPTIRTIIIIVEAVLVAWILKSIMHSSKLKNK